MTAVVARFGCIVSSMMMILLAFQVLVANVAASPPPGPQPTDPPVPPGEGPSPGTGQEGGGFGPQNESDPDGILNVTYEEPLNSTAAYANNTLQAYVVAANTSYVYVTSLGNVTFPGASPHIMSIQDLDERVMASAASFVVEGNLATSISGSYVLSATNQTFHTRYNVTSGGVQQGTLDTVVNFQPPAWPWGAAVVPKITATFALDANATLTSWHLRWKIITPAWYLRNAESGTYYFGDLASPVMMWSSPVGAPSAAVGSVADVPSWNSTLVANWTDAVTGTLYAGPVTIESNYSGHGLMVAFPNGVAQIDPTLISKSEDSYATRFTNQKKVFFHDGRYYAFFFHGTGVTKGIRYSAGREVTSTTGTANGGVVWDTPVQVVGNAKSLHGFDVDHRGGLVALAWVEEAGSDLYLKSKLGVVRGGQIDWQTTDLIVTMGGIILIPSIAIGADGIIWVAVPTFNCGCQTPEITVFRSALPWAVPDVTSTSSSLSDVWTIVRLVPHPNGDVTLIWSESPQSEVSWRVWTAASGSWSVSRVTSGLGLPINLYKHDRFTATTTRDSTSSPGARVLYIGSGGGVFATTLYATFFTAPTTIDTGPAYYPAIQADANEDLHMFWTERPCSAFQQCAKKVYYRWETVAGILSDTKIPFAPRGDPNFLSAAFHAQNQRAFLVYSDGSTTSAEVYFASVPTRRGVGGVGASAWDRPGIGSGAPVRQLSEFLNPANGLLYLKQTDISIPGRGLDLSIERVYRTPDVFVNTNEPWGFESPATYSVGQGWVLNFPFLTPFYMHLWDGQRFLLKWFGNVFENKDGEYFRLERAAGGAYYLYTRSGVKYNFVTFPNGIALEIITDTSLNQIIFSNVQYGTNGYRRLNAIIDTMGRQVSFDYVPSGTCPGSNAEPPRICKVTYQGRTVQYQYSNGNGPLLVSAVFDPLGLALMTQYEYCSSTCSVTNVWLPKAIVYPSGARSEFLWQAATVGSDAIAYLVTSQRLLSLGVLVRKKNYDYDLVNGVVVYARVSYYSDLSTMKGYVMYTMDTVTSSMAMLTVERPAVGPDKKLSQIRLWYGAGGRVLQQDAFVGAASIDSGVPTTSTWTEYDEYGNPLYARDAMGGETLLSYLNSNRQGSFNAPGRLDPTAPPINGKIWWETFQDRSVSDWTLDTLSGLCPYGTIGLDSSNFATNPPSLSLETIANDCGKSAAATHTIAAQSGKHVVNVLVRMRETSKSHYIKLQAGTVDRISINFDSDAKIKFTGGTSGFPSYVANRWYTVSIYVFDNSLSYNLWIDGQAPAPGTFSMSGSGAINTIRFQAGLFGSTAKMWVNEVGVFKDATVTVSDIQVGTRVRILDAATGAPTGPAFMVSGGVAYVNALPWQYPRIQLQVLDWEWNPIFTSPAREIWGGTAFKFIEPQFLSGFTKTSSGFLRTLYPWVDDTMPGTETKDPEGWSWSESADAVSGSKYHQSLPAPARHGHGFRDSSPFNPFSSSNYLIQYIYLTGLTPTSEVLRAYRNSNTGAWYRSFWGGSFDGFGGTNGSDARRWMGVAPRTTGRWIELIVQQEDVGQGANGWDAMSYYLVSGGARWDLTGLGDVNTGKLRVSGLPPSGQVRAVLKDGVSIAATADGTGYAEIPLYATANANRNAFPTSVTFTLFHWDAGLGQYVADYVSPRFDNVFGGDEFQWAGSNFYVPDGAGNPISVNPNIKDRLSGTRRIQSVTPSLIQETHFKYDGKGNLLETKAKAPSGTWITTARDYDLYGNVWKARSLYDDTHTHETTYSYSATYQYAFLTGVADGTFGTSSFTYKSDTGELESVTPPKVPAQITAYEYDAIGRPTKVTHPGGKSVTNEYFESGRRVVVKDELYSNPDRKRQTWQCYDSIGRLTDVLRFGDAGPSGSPSCASFTSSGYYSWERYTYNWQDLVTMYISAMGRQYEKVYDFLGRVTRIKNPDTVSWVDIAYDEAANTKTVTATTDVQSARKTVYLYDWNGRLTEVREIWGVGPNDFHPTSYAYDNVGNLLTVDTPLDSLNIRQRTTHEYDRLGRLTKTTFPDGTWEDYSYFNSGLLKQKNDRAGAVTTYSYDELKRLDVTTYPDGSAANSDYDPNGNLLKLTYTRPGANPVILDYTYDIRDRLKTEVSTVDSVARTVTYDYDDASDLVRIQGPAGSGYDVYYAYDAFNRACALSSVSISACSPSTYYAKMSYYADDALDTITYETGATDVTTKYGYHVNGWPSAIETKYGTTSYFRMDYEDYDALGDPLRIKHTGQGISTTYECFTYNALGRLIASNTATATSCANAAGSWSWNLAYTYDAIGNRLSVTDGSTTNYKYDTYSRLCRTKTGGTPTSCTQTGAGINEYAYNAKGEMTSRKIGGTTWTFAWGPEGEITSMSKTGYSASYAYDGLGRRVKSTIGGSTNVYVYSGLSVLYETNPATKHVFANGLRLARIQGSTTEYYHYDHLGNARLITSGTGARLATLAYKPFGLVIQVYGYVPSYAYTGEYLEWMPNLIYLHSRWYDPTIGRFISQDDRLGRLSMPQDQNRYAYVVNNPMAYTDPTGHDFWSDLKGFLFSPTIDVYGWALWWSGASEAERWGFAAAVIVAFAVGFAIGVLCVASVGIGCAVAAVFWPTLVAGITYLGVTVAAGGTPTREGLGWAFIGGGYAGAAGGAIGGAWASMRVPSAPRNGGIAEIKQRAGLTGQDAQGVADSTEAAALRRMYREGAEAVEHWPEGQGGPDFRIIGGPRAGPNGQAMAEVTLKGTVSDWKQIVHLSTYRDQGYGVVYYVGVADNAFRMWAKRFGVPVVPISGP